MEDSEGNTPLILAAKNGRVEVVRLLLKNKADISLRNKQDQTCLDAAVENGRVLVAMEIVKSKNWYDVLRHRPHKNRFPMRDLIESMPSVAEIVMNKCIKYSDLDKKDRDYWIELDFRLLHSEKNENTVLKQNSKFCFFAPMTMIESQRESLISHPLIETYLLLRWNCLGRPIFWMNIFFYIIYIYLFTSFLVQRRNDTTFYRASDIQIRGEEKKSFNKDRYSLAIPAIVTMIVSFHMMKEIYQIYFQRLRYFFHITNYLEWAGFIASLFFMIPFLHRRDLYINTGALWPVGAIAVLFIYFNLILFLRRFGMFGIYISMFIEVLKTMGKVVGVFSLFILAFALTFFTLLKEQKSFRSVTWSFVKTSMMMIGDIDYEALITVSLEERDPLTGAPHVPVPEFTVVILLIFCFFLPVLLMNLLIGLAVGDIDSIQKNASMQRKAMEVDYIATIEERYPKILIHYIHKPITIIYPNKHDFINLMKLSTFGSSSRNFSFEKMQSYDSEDDLKVLTEELAEQKNRTKEMQSTIGEQNELLKSFSKRLQTLSDRTKSASAFSFDDIDSSLRNIDISRSDTVSGTPPAEL